VGEQMQVPPAYSAKRSGGERLYDLARRGVAVERPPVRVVVYALDVRRAEGAEVEMEVRCAPGTYVRAIARDLGELLGTGAHLVALRRIRSGTFGEETAVGWDDVPVRGREALIPMAALLPDLPAVTVTDEGERALRFGRDLAAPLLVGGFPAATGPRWRVLDGSGALVALASPRGAATEGELPVDPVLHPDIVLLETAGGG